MQDLATLLLLPHIHNHVAFGSFHSSSTQSLWSFLPPPSLCCQVKNTHTKNKKPSGVFPHCSVLQQSAWIILLYTLTKWLRVLHLRAREREWKKQRKAPCKDVSVFYSSCLNEQSPGPNDHCRPCHPKCDYLPKKCTKLTLAAKAPNPPQKMKE